MMLRTRTSEARSADALAAAIRLILWSLGRRVLLLLSMMAACGSYARAQSADPADQVCPRFSPGSTISAPPDLYSASGTLEVTFTYQTTVDQQGLTRYCYI